MNTTTIGGVEYVRCDGVTDLDDLQAVLAGIRPDDLTPDEVRQLLEVLVPVADRVGVR